MRDIWSRKEVHNSFREQSSGNSHRHSKARVAIVWPLMRAGFILSGRGGSWGRAEVYVQQSTAWSGLRRGGWTEIGEIRCGNLTNIRSRREGCWLTRKRVGVRTHWWRRESVVDEMHFLFCFTKKNIRRMSQFVTYRYAGMYRVMQCDEVCVCVSSIQKM